MRTLAFNPGWPDEYKRLWRFDKDQLWGQQGPSMLFYEYQNRLKLQLSWIRACLRPVARILDVGAAQGNLALLLAERGYHVVANDINPESLEYARLKHEKGFVDWCPGNFLELRFESPFDLIVAGELIEHVAHPDILLAKCKDALNNEGYVLITTPNGTFFRNRLPTYSQVASPGDLEDRQFRPDADGHLFLSSPHELHALLLRLGFRIVKKSLFNTPFVAEKLRKTYLKGIVHPTILYAMDRLVARTMTAQSRVCISQAVLAQKP